jgi:DNA polymerase-3 subunit alpha
MKYDQFGVSYTTEDELFALLYEQPDLDLKNFQVVDPTGFNKSVADMFADMPILKTYIPYNVDVSEFDRLQQAHWYIPDEYYNIDIAQLILDQCSTDAELQRCGEELLLFQERELFDLLKYLRFLVDIFRKNNVVWGVGRGSSVASFVLYKIGVHKINSLYYDLDPAEFLK